MNVHQRLNDARTAFHSLKMEKTGHNKFAGYKYFELGDFLIPALKVFREAGLCAVVSFEKELARMTICCVDKPADFISITSPMGSAALKGCHEVQNIGAVEMYQRRYLWVAALEIVEHDALDATTGKDAPEAALDGFTRHESAIIRRSAAAAIVAFNEGNEWTAYEEVTSCRDKIGGSDQPKRNDVTEALNTIFQPHSALRSSLKASRERELTRTEQ